MTKSRNNVIILQAIKNYTILKWGLGRSPKRGEGGSPTFSPGTDAGRVCTRALHDAKPTKHTQPFTGERGQGDRDNKSEVNFKNRLFLQSTKFLYRNFYLYFFFTRFNAYPF